MSEGHKAWQKRRPPHKLGMIPARFAKRTVIRKKWKAVADIVKRVAAATR